MPTLIAMPSRLQVGGKGAAVKTGLAELAKLGFTHAFQVDADGQHALEDIPRFTAFARVHPDALILGSPAFDDTAPRARVIGRQITRFFTHCETVGRVITDPMCGFRVYPIATALALYAFYAFLIGPLIFPDPTVRYFKTQTLVGEPKGLFSKFRSSLAALSKMRSFVHQGYDEVSEIGNAESDDFFVMAWPLLVMQELCCQPVY